MSVALSLVVAIPLLGAAVSAMARRNIAIQRVVGILSTGGVLLLSAILLLEADRGGPVVSALGGWGSPIGISLVVDRFSALLLVASAIMVLAVLVYSISQLGRDVLDWWFHPKYLALTTGVAIALTTADLFSLFVGFEVLLIASYTLLTVRSGSRQVRSTMTYVVVNMVASALFLIAVSLAYGVTGTLDMADMAGRLERVDPDLSTALSAMTLVVFGIKAALFPLYMWLPDSYPTAPAPVTALFAGLLTKVGVYAIFRTQTLVFDAGSDLLLVVAGATMFLGVVGAMAQRDVKRILSFHIISQIGYMIMGLGLASALGVAAGIAYVVNQIIVKTGLFLVAGEIEFENGDSGLDAGGGLAERRPWLALSFGLLALSLAGAPPFAGFVLKYALVREAISLGHWLVAGVALFVSFLTLFSMLKIWAGVFWGEPAGDGGRARLGMRAATASVAALSVFVAVWAGGLVDLSTRASVEIADPLVYATAVLE